MGGIIVGGAIMLHAGLRLWLELIIASWQKSKLLTLFIIAAPFVAITVSSLTPVHTKDSSKMYNLAADPCFAAGRTGFTDRNGNVDQSLSKKCMRPNNLAKYPNPNAR